MLRVTRLLHTLATLGFAFGLLLAGGIRPVTAQDAASRPAPCEADERYRAFDFWIGHWEVYDEAGEKHYGTNHIEKQERGCLLMERWTGAGGGTGTSMNYYDPARDKWVQVWVAGGGTVIEMEGGLVNGSMRLEGVLVNKEGAATPFRGTWTPLADGRVRQFFEQSTDDGQTWTGWFDGYYVRKAMDE